MKLVFIVRKNLFPAHLIDKCVYWYLKTAIDRFRSTQSPPSSNTTSQGKQQFCKLPYLGRFSAVAQGKLRRLVNRYCNDLDIKLMFITFNLRNLFSVKDSVPSSENFVHVWFKNLLVLSVMLAFWAKLVVIFPHASVNISLQTSIYSSSNTYKAQNVAVNLALGIVSKSLIPHPLNFNLNLRRLCI